MVNRARFVSLAAAAGAFACSAIADVFGLDVDVMIRTSAELHRTLSENPFAGRAEGNRIHCAFLSRNPEADAVAAILDLEVGSEELAFGDRVAYVHLPHGSARARLSNSFLERKLGLRSTMRNLNTVEALARVVDAE